MYHPPILNKNLFFISWQLCPLSSKQFRNFWERQSRIISSDLLTSVIQEPNVAGQRLFGCVHVTSSLTFLTLRPTTFLSLQNYKNTHSPNLTNTHVWIHVAIRLHGNALVSINKVTLRQVQLVLWWVTICRWVNHLSTNPANQVNSAWPSLHGWVGTMSTSES